MAYSINYKASFGEKTMDEFVYEENRLRATIMVNKLNIRIATSEQDGITQEITIPMHESRMLVKFITERLAIPKFPQEL